MTRLFSILGILTIALIGVLWLAGVIDRNVAGDTLARGLGIVALLCFGSGLAVRLLPRRPPAPASNKNEGPRF